uniref:Uncharacterized protein n=1 Tax=Vespula pensylvanica TaxID=30213 RepID=A0A834P4K6_VESPE|nr:hypothetical protein H0235_007283 [Vespula pensylvanica]
MVLYYCLPPPVVAVAVAVAGVVTVAEIEAQEACKWLRAAGFPQYAQMYEGPGYWSNLSHKTIGYEVDLISKTDHTNQSGKKYGERRGGEQAAPVRNGPPEANRYVTASRTSNVPQDTTFGVLDLDIHAYSGTILALYFYSIIVEAMKEINEKVKENEIEKR